ncbi:carboxypeptidase regulatory-like domain-containing protein [Clavibacter sepedonicus]|uniref:carboxypeptidase regulatory-like domain-containing protein n=1 Tax=Clavibacter sepedonicus TaxID=31964 RepID=UPI003DA3B325
MSSVRRRAVVGLVSLALVASAQVGIASGASAATAPAPTPAGSAAATAATPAALVFTASPTPTVRGTTEVGATLTAVTGTWTPTPGTFLYRWARDGVAIPGATRATYALVAADQGKRLTVSVTAVKTRYPSTTRTSEPTTAVAPKGGAPEVRLPFTAAPVPTITGSVTVGGTVTAVPGSWSPSPRLAYQWFAGSTAIRDANVATYEPTAADLGQELSVSVAAFRDGYATTTRMSAGAIVSEGTFPERTFVIRGEARVGGYLDVANETYSYEADRTYTWAADGVTIAGETSDGYRPVVADIGKRITATITGSAAGFTTETRTTTPTAPVVAADAAPVVETGVVSGRVFLGSATDANLLGDGIVSASRVSDGTGRDGRLVDGSFEVRDLGPGVYTLSVFTEVDGVYASQPYRAPGDPARATRFTVTNDGAVRLDVVLVRHASISGTVTQSDGQPAVGSNVEVFPVRGGEPVGGGRTDAAGRFRISSEWLTPGQYEVRFGAPFENPEGYIGEWYGDTDDRNRAKRITVVGTDAVTGIDAELTRGSRLEGVLQAGAAGEESSAVYLVPETAALLGSGPRSGRLTGVDQSGRFSLTQITPGRYYVYAQTTRYEAPSYGPQWVGGTGTLATATVFTVRRGADLPFLDIRMKQDSSVTVVLAGVTAPGWEQRAIVELLQDGVIPGSSTFIPNVAPGTYRVRVSHIRDGVWIPTWWAGGTGADRSRIVVNVDRSVRIAVRAATGTEPPAQAR